MEPETKNHLRNGLLLATLLTLLFNASNLLLMNKAEPPLEMKTTAMDELYYLALIREASEGHLRLGSPSLKEHRDDPSVVRYLPILPGLIMRGTGMSLGAAIFLMDLLCPFLITFLFFLAWRGLFANSLEAAVATVIPLGFVFRGGMFNVINPKMVLPFVTLHLFLLFGIAKPRPIHFILRGGSLALLFYVYPHFFLYFAAFEACLFLTRKSSLRSALTGIACIGVPFLLLISPLLFTTIMGQENPAAADLWYRIVSPTFLPADPKMQVTLLIAIGALLFERKRHGMSKGNTSLLLALSTGLIMLNQSLVHGLDLMAGLHYFYLLWMFLWITGIFLVTRFFRHPVFLRIAAITLILLSLLNIGEYVHRVHTERLRLAAEFSASDISTVLEFLKSEEGEKVILAGDDIANLIPIFTNHYVAMNGYAGFQSGSDSELAERYILQDAIAPRAEHEPSYPAIFSVHAGNRAARERTWCRITSFFRKSREECEVPIRDFIRHYELLPMIDSSLAEHNPAQTLELLQKFNVDIIVTKEKLPQIVERECPREREIGVYGMYRCS